jgi:hypothetical protein
MHFVQCRIDGVRPEVTMQPHRSASFRSGITVTRSSTRIYLGCIAGAVSVLVFHQTTLQLFFWCGLAAQAAFRVAVVLPFHAPMVVSITFWGAIYGGVFGWLTPRLPRLALARALLAGLFALLMGWFVVRPLAGHPVAFGWQVAPMLRSAAACMMWGIGVTLILPLLLPREITGSRRIVGRQHLAT